jgi:hypothetical protein
MRYRRAFLRRKALLSTDTEENLIAATPIIGESKKTGLPVGSLRPNSQVPNQKA